MLVPALILVLHAVPIARAATTLPEVAAEARLRRAAMSAGEMAVLHKKLMDKVEAMDTARSGIFNEDVTTTVDPYFPAGQPFKETAATVRDQGLGELQPFKGRTRPDDGTMFVASFSLMSHVFARVFVVLHFGFRKAEDGTLVLDHMRAFLRSQSM